MHHHTGDDASDAADRAVLVHGRPGLRGPLANFGVTDGGRIDIVSAGAANHAGKGDPRVLEAVRLESYGRFPPATHKHQGSPGAVGGNGKFYGWETYYGAGDDPTINEKQYRALVLSTAAIISALDAIDGPATRWTGRSCIGHKEWTDHKVDPRKIDMSVDRADIQWCLDHGPTAAKRWFDTGQRTPGIAGFATTATTAGTAGIAPPTTAKEAIMHTLVQLEHTDPVWISDLITRRWVQSAKELAAVQKSLKKAGVETDVSVVSTLAPYGVPVGPLPQ
jgi:hypothetical protein